MAEQVNTGSQPEPHTSQHEAQSLQSETLEMAFQNRHNICAYIDKDGLDTATKSIFERLLDFLVRSRIHKAITEDAVVSKPQIEEFWRTAKVLAPEGHKMIKATVAGSSILITEGILRTVLGIEDKDEDRIDLDKEKVRGCLMRCGYPSVSGIVHKKHFCPPFKYLAHIMIHSLGSKKAGYDTMSEILQNAMAALVLNMKFNFSRMIFNGMMENANSKNKFLMFPRFVQLVINDQEPNLTRVNSEVLILSHMNAASVKTMRDYTGGVMPRDVPLFGHLIKEDYVCPPGKEWKGADSDAEDEVVITQVVQPAGAKRKAKGKTVEDVGFETRSRKKPSLEYKEKPTPSAGAPPETHTRQSSSTPTPSGSTVVAADPTETERKMSSLQTLMIELQNKQYKLERETAEKLKASEEKLKAANDKIKELEELNKTTNDLLIAEMEKRLIYERKVDRLRMNEDGVYVDVDYLTTEDQLECDDAAGASGTAHE